MKRRRLLVAQEETDGMIAQALRQQFETVHLEQVTTPAALTAALARLRWDAVLIDCDAPGFGLRDVLARGVLGSAEPVILVSWGLGEAGAVEAMKAGARDCVLKSDLGRLGPTLAHELGTVPIRFPARRRKAPRGRLRPVAG